MQKVPATRLTRVHLAVVDVEVDFGTAGGGDGGGGVVDDVVVVVVEVVVVVVDFSTILPWTCQSPYRSLKERLLLFRLTLICFESYT